MNEKNENFETKPKVNSKYETTKEFISLKVEKESHQSSNLLDEDIEYP